MLTMLIHQAEIPYLTDTCTVWMYAISTYKSFKLVAMFNKKSFAIFRSVSIYFPSEEGPETSQLVFLFA